MVRASTSEGRRGRLRAVESLAGWIFADMLLVLFLVGVGTAIPHAPPPPPPKIEKPKPTIVGMKTVPVKRTITIDADGITRRDKTAQSRACKALKEAFRPQIVAGDRAAFVLVFGGGTNPSAAALVAERLYPQLNCASDVVFPKKTVGRFYWDGKMSGDTARIEVFSYTTKEATTP
jgi:hypothetical protein